MDAQTLVNRLTYGAAAIAAIFTVVMVDAFLATEYGDRLGGLVSYGSLIPLLFAALSVVGALELCRLMRMAGLRPDALWAVFSSGLLTLSPWLISGAVLRWNMSDLLGYQWLLAALGFALVGSVFGALRKREMTGAIADIAATWTIILYTGLLPCFALQLRCHTYLHGAGGAWLILIFVFVVKVSDIGAWTTGMLIGRHKLIPWISPKKTIEGALGGILLSAVVALLFWQLHPWTEPDMTQTTPPAASQKMENESTPDDIKVRCNALAHEMTRDFAVLKQWQAIVFGILMSIFGQLGDLLESCFKRAAGAKDSAAVLPAFGGVLDIIDSPLIAAPVAWFLLTCWWPVV